MALALRKLRLEDDEFKTRANATLVFMKKCVLWVLKRILQLLI